MNASKTIGAGVFVVLGILIFTVALFMIGERRMLFADRFALYTEFAELGQLEVGSIVRVAGADAGEVTEIRIPSGPAGKFRVKMDVREDLHPLVRTDSLATTQTEGLVGAIFINIAAGSEQAPRVAVEGTIPGKEPASMADLFEQANKTLGQAGETVALINETVKGLQGDIENAVQQVAATAEEAHALVTEISPQIMTIANSGAKISTDTQAMLAGVREGRGTFGKLLNDDTLYRRATEIADQATAVMGNVREVSTEMRRAISDFRSSDGPAQGLMGDMRVTLGQAREATADLADNMEAMKRNFLLRGFFNRRGYFDLNDISPENYRNGALEDGKRRAMRIWLGSPVLFEAGADGRETLSAVGRARIDSAMATYLNYVPANPIVVEGYATAGATEERFRLARDRAGVVRSYIMGRFGLTPQNTGSIGLGSDAKDSPDGGRWDGVAITLFLDRASVQFGGEPVK